MDGHDDTRARPAESPPTTDHAPPKHKGALGGRAARPRNDLLFDIWSIVHLGSGILAALFLPPFVAFTLLVLWEPFEILLLSPFLARFGIDFGHETLRNSLSDIVFDGAGVLIGHLLIGQLWDPIGPWFL